MKTNNNKPKRNPIPHDGYAVLGDVTQTLLEYNMENINAKHGTKVKFLGCSVSQKNWGNHTGDITKLSIGNVYTIDKTEVHTWHTKVYLLEVGGSFNSVCFDELQ